MLIFKVAVNKTIAKNEHTQKKSVEDLYKFYKSFNLKTLDLTLNLLT